MWRVVLSLLVCLFILTAIGCGPSYTGADRARDQVRDADALEAETQSGEMDPDEEE
jgi:hypothetical protein